MSNTKKPIIFSIDDDPQVLRSIRRDLRSAYKADYRIFSSESAFEALSALEELKKKGETVALFLSDQRMPEMLGVEFLEKARPFFPEARRVLLTAYSDIDAAIRAINEVQLDYYLLKPWDPPSEKLYPVLDDLLDEWRSSYRPNFRGIRVVGFQFSPHTHRIKDFLAGNLLPYQWLDIENDPRARDLTELHTLQNSDLPAVIFEDGSVLQKPELQDIAPKVGLQPKATSEIYDVVIIGAGPAGLAAGVYGGSEGLKTLLVERHAPGGQAGTSSRIENYLGFPKGLSGSELSRRAVTQATRFGVELLSPQEVEQISIDGLYKTLQLKNGEKVITRSVVISTGVDYRRLPAEGVDQFTGAGVYYGAAITEARACKEKQIYIVGGGNSAGQGAVYLAQFAKKVTILIRKPDLSSSMSSYLIEQIAALPQIEVRGYSQVASARGADRLQELTIKDLQSGKEYTESADVLFIFIGARPATSWLPENILRNEKGYIYTGRELTNRPGYPKFWKEGREPFLLETCQPGIFAAGDVRAGAMNRVASAVGEGAMAIKLVHEYLAEN